MYSVHAQQTLSTKLSKITICKKLDPQALYGRITTSLHTVNVHRQTQGTF